MTTLLFGTEDGQLMVGPAVLIEGQLWLVASWREQTESEFWRPEVAIPVPMEAVQHCPDCADYEYLLSGSIPKLAFQGHTAQWQGLLFVPEVRPAWKVAVPSLN
ncbi:hypothetical protein [Pseudoxanthomonas dokdonensis]|uniref:hypothetical protein n=1 Tax=Pseudoxanthomonas dokdonensis TaxID=344882 RepID=UPI0012EE7434|nr:hypothetical protein [Pseudoxanthomonas dokdonensis]